MWYFVLYAAFAEDKSRWPSFPTHIQQRRDTHARKRENHIYW